MAIKMFGIYDEKAACFDRPFFAPSVGVCIRSISDALSDPSVTFSKHPSDYTLFELGTFDECTGHLEPTKKSLGCLVEFKTLED